MVFEVLVVFHGAPGAAPDEAVFDEQTVAEVAFIDLVAELLAAVGIGLAVGGFNDPTAILRMADIGIVERIDVDGEAAGVIGERLRTRDGAITEPAGVVVAHLTLSVGIILISQADALDRVVGLVELAEDSEQLVGYQPIADDFSLMGLMVVVPMEHAQIAQVATADVGIVDIGLALHLLPDGIGDGLGSKAIRSVLALHRSTKPEQNCSYCYAAVVSLHILTDYFLSALDIDAMTGGLTIEAYTADGIDRSLGIGFGLK